MRLGSAQTFAVGITSPFNANISTKMKAALGNDQLNHSVMLDIAKVIESYAIGI